MVHDIVQAIVQLTGITAPAGLMAITILVRIGIVATLFLAGISVFAMFAIWLERKLAGHMQSRVGPMHVGLWHGWAQSIADGAKLLMKEDLIPDGADNFLFRLAPYLAFTPVFAAFLALPFGPQLTFEPALNIGVLYLLAVLGVEVMGVILAGWASNNKWSVYGAMREACQMVSYEIPLGLSILCGVLAAGTLNLTELAYLQTGGMHQWFVFQSPFLFVAFFVYFVASLASNKRAPFDLPESESELVAGFHTEYSGMRFSLFFFAEYAAMFVVGGIQAGLFLGSWASPLGSLDPIYYLCGFHPGTAGVAYYNGSLTSAVGWQQTATAMGLSDQFLPLAGSLLLFNLYAMAWFCLKAMAVVIIQMWLRWTLPRYRIDQVLHGCVKVLLPLSLVCLVGTAAWILLVPQPVGELVHGQIESRLGHLIGPTPTLQLITQIGLTAIGLALIASCALVVVYAWLTRKRTFKTMFADVMPVGDRIAFTKF